MEKHCGSLLCGVATSNLKFIHIELQVWILWKVQSESLMPEVSATIHHLNKPSHRASRGENLPSHFPGFQAQVAAPLLPSRAHSKEPAQAAKGLKNHLLMSNFRSAVCLPDYIV
jgi:hypothetical protein